MNPQESATNELQDILVEMWEKVLNLDGVGTDEDFFALGGDSIAAMRFTNMLQQRLGEVVQVTVLYELPTIAKLAEYLAETYEDAVAAILGRPENGSSKQTARQLTERDVAYVKETVSALDRFSAAGGDRKASTQQKNPQAVFILCTARSGSTLLRVMLGGHPKLFAPPELVLLPFDSLKQRREIFSGPRSIWSEGVIRTIMEIRGCDADQAKQELEHYEGMDLSVQEFYTLLQRSLNGRRLVDKSPSYSQTMRVLQRAEDYFENAMYIHLLRHPIAMIASYERQKIEQLSFKENLGYESRQLAELLWVVSHRNIIDFLTHIPKERQCRVVFENLVTQPRRVMEDVCAFLNLEFDEEVLTPHKNQAGKMTDGSRPSSRMLGDPKFHNYKSIDPGVADSWKHADRPVALSEITWRLAEVLGYESPIEQDQEVNFPTSLAGKSLNLVRESEIAG